MRANGSGCSNLKWIITEMVPYWPWQLASIVCLLGNAAALLTVPLLLKYVIDQAIPAHDVRWLIIVMSLYLATSATRVVIGGCANYLIFKMNQRLVLRLRVRLFNHLSSLSSGYHSATPVGESMYVLQDSLAVLTEVSADFLAIYLRAIILFSGALAVMLRLNLGLTLLTFPYMFLYALIARYFTYTLAKACDEFQDVSAKASGFLQEHLTSAIQVQLLCREQRQTRKAFRVWADLFRSGQRRNNREIFYGAISTLTVVAATVTVLCFGALKVVSGSLTIGTLVAFYGYMDRLFDPLYVTVDLQSRFQRAAASIRRIRNLFDTAPTIRSPRDGIRLPVSHGAGISMERLSFSYTAGRAAVHDINLQVNHADRLAIVGPSGSGKSTLAKLLVRLHDPDAGTIRIDQCDIRQLTLKSLRTTVCYVPQRPALFDTTMEDNLRYGNPWVTASDLRRAAEDSALEPIIRKLPRGWKEPLGPSGSLLSGGEQQRVAIARALLQGAGIFIFDESTSQMDTTTERDVFAALNRRLPHSTLIIITHRLIAITWVDRIIVLNGGRITAQGNHDDLYHHDALYTTLFRDPLHPASGVLAHRSTPLAPADQ